MKKLIFLLTTLFLTNIAFSQDMAIYDGTTNANTFGDAQILWFSNNENGSLLYEHVKNKFYIKKSGSKYTLYESSKKSILELEFEFRDGKKRLMKVVKGENFFSDTQINIEKKKVAIANEKEFIIAIAKSLHDLLKDKYRPFGNYTFTYKNHANGSGIVLATDDGTAYVGDFIEGRFNGKGKLVFNDYYSEGSFKTGKKQGYFKIVNNDGRSSEGRYVANERDGVWKIKEKNGQTVEKTYKNGIEQETTSKKDKVVKNNSNKNQPITIKEDSNLTNARIEIEKTLDVFTQAKSTYDFLAVNMKSMKLREVKVKMAPLVNEYKARRQAVCSCQNTIRKNGNRIFSKISR